MIRALCAALVLLGCAPEPALDPIARLLEAGRRYQDDPAARRAALEAALVNPANTYSARRLERYRPSIWGALPIWRPRTRPVGARDIGGPVPELGAPGFSELDVEGAAWTLDSLVALGRSAFFRYPVQVTPALREALATGAPPDRFGLGAGGGVDGFVWAELPGGVEAACTCATCHARPDEAGVLIPGANNPALDFGGLLDAFHRQRGPRSAWGRGRVDVTADGLENATVIPDLRPVRFQTHLHRAGTLVNDPVALAIRIETQLITSWSEIARPPRKLSFALALFLWSLGESLPAPAADSAGWAIFQAECAGCHGSDPGLAGPLLPLDRAGTDPTVGESPARTTGAYRIPSLRGIGDRTLLLAGGAVRDVAALLDPDRSEGGHPFGQRLAAGDRRALIAFLQGL